MEKEIKIKVVVDKEEESKKEEVKKKKGLFSSLVDGDWVDNLSNDWGKPKSYNKDWYKGGGSGGEKKE
jgi:hypothetical protein